MHFIENNIGRIWGQIWPQELHGERLSTGFTSFTTNSATDANTKWPTTLAISPSAIAQPGRKQLQENLIFSGNFSYAVSWLAQTNTISNIFPLPIWYHDRGGFDIKIRSIIFQQKIMLGASKSPFWYTHSTISSDISKSQDILLELRLVLPYWLPWRRMYDRRETFLYACSS